MAEQHDQSNDDCLLCGAIYCGEAGWPLCDTPGCANVCCASCVATTGLSVGDLFYCPACAGGGESAAAVAGGALTAATLGLVDLSKMPLSLKALRSVVKNARNDDPKYRRLRLANPKVARALDVPPARRCLATLGFVERDEGGERVLVADAKPDADIADDVAALLQGLDDDDDDGAPPPTAKRDRDDGAATATEERDAKRPATGAPSEPAMDPSEEQKPA